MPARLNLSQHLHDDGCLATSGVADNLEMLILSPQWNAEHLLALIDLDADSRPCNGLVELLRLHENRPLETPPVFHFLSAADVLRDRPRNHQNEPEAAKD
jgi:hypothetical protein